MFNRQIEEILENHEKRLNELEGKESKKKLEPIDTPEGARQRDEIRDKILKKAEKEEKNPIIEGIKNAAMTKEAIASVELDRGQTQTFSEEDIKTEEESEEQTKESGKIKLGAYTRDPPIKKRR